LMCAFGLALQGVDAARFKVSLAFRPLRWQAQRRRHFVSLAAAVCLAALLAVAVQARTYYRLLHRQAELQESLRQVELSSGIVPDLEAVIREIDHRQLMLLPFAEKGNHAWRFHAAIRELAAARNRMLNETRPDRPAGDLEGWVIYLADQVSFQTGKDHEAGLEAPSAAGAAPAVFRPLLGPAAVPRQAPAADAGRILVTRIKPWPGLVAAVYTATETHEPYRLVRRFVSELNNSDLFAGVDLMPEPESAGREDIFVPWAKVPENMIPGDYKRFFLKLPFQTLDVKLAQTDTVP